jgi:hypothetical protein
VRAKGVRHHKESILSGFGITDTLRERDDTNKIRLRGFGYPIF